MNYKSIIANYSNEDYEAVLNSETSYGASMWLTNIVSASTGIRTLNIDLGFSTQTSVSDNGFSLTVKDGSLASSISDEFTPFSTKVGVDLRILGSSLPRYEFGL